MPPVYALSALQRQDQEPEGEGTKTSELVLITLALAASIILAIIPSSKELNRTRNPASTIFIVTCAVLSSFGALVLSFVALTLGWTREISLDALAGVVFALAPALIQLPRDTLKYGWLALRMRDRRSLCIRTHRFRYVRLGKKSCGADPNSSEDEWTAPFPKSCKGENCKVKMFIRILPIKPRPKWIAFFRGDRHVGFGVEGKTQLSAVEIMQRADAKKPAEGRQRPAPSPAASATVPATVPPRVGQSATVPPTVAQPAATLPDAAPAAAASAAAVPAAAAPVAAAPVAAAPVAAAPVAAASASIPAAAVPPSQTSATTPPVPTLALPAQSPGNATPSAILSPMSPSTSGARLTPFGPQNTRADVVASQSRSKDRGGAGAAPGNTGSESEKKEFLHWHGRRVGHSKNFVQLRDLDDGITSWWWDSVSSAVLLVDKPSDCCVQNRLRMLNALALLSDIISIGDLVIHHRKSFLRYQLKNNDGVRMSIMATPGIMCNKIMQALGLDNWGKLGLDTLNDEEWTKSRKKYGILFLILTEKSDMYSENPRKDREDELRLDIANSVTQPFLSEEQQCEKGLWRKVRSYFKDVRHHHRLHHRLSGQAVLDDLMKSGEEEPKAFEKLSRQKVDDWLHEWGCRRETLEPEKDIEEKMSGVTRAAATGSTTVPGTQPAPGPARAAPLVPAPAPAPAPAPTLTPAVPPPTAAAVIVGP